MEKNDDVQVIETVGSVSMESITRGEIDIQISTAHKFPRNITRFQEKSIKHVELSSEVAESCIYNRPVGKEHGVMKFAEGRSIRMAEIVAANYENLRIMGIIIEIAPRHVIARGMVHDLETNVAASADVIESFATKTGVMSERMKIVVAKAAVSKAIRDAIFRIVPRSLCDPIEDAARQVCGKMGIDERSKRAMVWINKLGIDTERVFKALGIKDETELTEEKLDILAGNKTAINDGEITIDEAFPPIEPKGPEDTKGSRQKIGFGKEPSKVEEAPIIKKLWTQR